MELPPPSGSALPALAIVVPPRASAEPQTFAWRADGVFSRSGLLIGASGATARGRVALELNLDDFVMGAELGRGSSSIVWRATHARTGADVAVKCVRMNTHASRVALVNELLALWVGDSADGVESASAGAVVSRHAATAADGIADCTGSAADVRAPHALVNTLLGACSRDGAVYLALELMDAGSLESVCLRAGGPLPERALAGIAFCLFSALGALSAERRLHRDVKPSNVLLDSSGAVALSDFGLARTLDVEDKARSFVGTQRFLAPERLRGDAYDFSADVWAAGATLWYAAAGRPPFSEVSDAEDVGPIELTARILSEPELAPPADRPFSEGLATLVFNATRRNPVDRLSALALLGSPWFSEHDVWSVKDAMRVVREYFAGSPASGGARSGAAAGGDAASPSSHIDEKPASALPNFSSNFAASHTRPSPTASDARAALRRLLSEKDETALALPTRGEETFDIL
jgi:serine/threonine protein kinase